MASVEKFEDLEAWQMARKLANEIYASSSRGAFGRDFVLRDQIRRAAVSVISNIAEGFEKFEQLQTLASDVGKKIGGLIAYLKKSGLKGSKYKGQELETRNSKPGTGSPEPETRNPKPESRQAGFSIITAVFLVVVLALLGAFIVSVTGLQQSSQVLDVQGVRAYQAARAGLEWGAYQVLDPNNTLNPATCLPVVMPSCPASPTNISSLAGSLSTFTVTVTCVASAATTEGNREVRGYQIVATACNQPPCPNAAPATGYVERQVQATLSKCKDPTAAAPRCACG